MNISAVRSIVVGARGVSFEAVNIHTIRSRSREPQSLRELLAASRIRCQRGGDESSAAECLRCPRIVSVRPTANLRSAAIQCLWTDRDCVEDLMTLASALTFVSPDLDIESADELARTSGNRHLLVADGNRVLGIVCRCDLVADAGRGRRVADRMSSPIWSIEPWTDLGAAAQIMKERRVGCLLVVEGGEVAGVITRGDLRRAGLDEDLLGGSRCAACGSPHGVRPHPKLESVEFCLDCLELETTPIDYAELGIGD
jgi:CBS domain-containing protein